MAVETPKPTNNGTFIIMGVSDDASLEPRMFRMNASTNRLEVDALITGGTVTVDTTGLATSAKQDDIITAIGNIPGGGGTQYATNAAYADGNTGTLALTIRDDVLTTLTEADGDYSGLRVDSTGALWVNFTDTSLTVSATDLDIRDLTSASDSVEVLQNTAGDLNMVAWGWDGAANRAISTQADGAVNIHDGGNTITVDGTVAFSNSTIAVTNTGTFAVQAAQSGTWNITNISGTISLPTGAATAAKQPALGTAGTASADVITVQGITSMTPLLVDGSGVTQPVSGTVTANLSATDNTVLDNIDADTSAIQTAVELIDNAVSGAGFNITQFAGAAVPIGAGVEATALRVTLATDSTGVVSVDDNGGALTVDGTITANAGTDLNTSLLALETGGNLAAAATSLGSLDNSVDGNYLNVNMNLAGTDVSTTNAVPTKGVPSDIDINGSNANHAQKYYTNAGAVTDGIVWSPAAGKRWHVLSLYINVSAAATVTLEDDLGAGDSAVWKGELAANSGVILKYDKEHPFSSGEDAADLIITTTAGNVYVQAVGYEV